MNNVLVTFFASFWIWFLFAGLFILWIIDGRIKKEQVIHALLACFTTWVLALIIKYFFPTFRPFLIDGGGVLTLTTPFGGSFPSEHTSIAFALSTTIFMHDRRVGWLFLVSAILIGGARVLANVHYPLDIFGGAFLGTLTAVIIEKVHLFKLLSRK